MPSRSIARVCHPVISIRIPGSFRPRRRLALQLALLTGLVLGCGNGAPLTPGNTAPASPETATPGATSAATPSSTPAATDGPVLLGAHLAATIPVDRAPCALAANATSAWVTSIQTGQVDRIDPTTNSVVDRITVGGSPCGIAIGPDGRIWVAELKSGTILAIDPLTLQVTGRIEGVGPQLWDLKSGFGSVWVVDRDAGMLLRVDPVTATVSASIPIGRLGSGLAVTTSSVWVSDDADGSIRRIDPTSNAVVDSSDVGKSPSWFADDGAGRLVIARRTGGSVLVVNPATGELGAAIDGWVQPLDGTVFGNDAWIPDGSAGTITVLDLNVGAYLARYVLPEAVNPFVAERAFGDVWVLDFGGTTIWRLRP
ncbi:MAG: hypothetical protein ABI598_05215 [Chloroflexota bacterium]